jgi:hypothetical protein
LIEKFNFYDIYGYLLPGAVALLLFWLPIGIKQHKLPTGDWTSALLGAAIAYVAGVLLQTFADRVLPSSLGKVGSGKDSYDLYPSQKILGPYDPVYTGSQLSEVIKNGLPDLIKTKLGVDGDLAINKPADQTQARLRNDAFFLARHYLQLTKVTSYTEQFEGMYALCRGLAAALGLAAVYFLGWALSSWEFSWIPNVAYCAIAWGISFSVGVTIFLLVIGKRSLTVSVNKRNLKVELLPAIGLLVAGLGGGLGLGYRYHVSDLAIIILLCAVGALLASLRAYRFYREFTKEFAATVWRDFFLAAKQPPPAKES